MKITLALAAMALTLTACGGDTEPTSDAPPPPPVTVTAEPSPVTVTETVAPTPTPTPTPKPKPKPAPAPDLSEADAASLYGSLLRSEFPVAFRGVSDRMLADLATNMCGAFDAGTTFEDAVMVATGAGYTFEQAGYLIGAGVEAFCPENEGVLP